MSIFESNCSVKKRRRSAPVRTKTKAKQAEARTTNETKIIQKKNNNDNKDLLCEPNLRNKYMKETCRIFYMRLLRMRPACPTNKYPVFKGSYYKQFNYTGEGANAVASLSKAQ
jgi:hypothetical protein